ncbi:hypothetical protein AGABI2DRAFT_137009 [Agaricus bisporus var. bisporus H97]|uniref:hypothetical protein n=1 Tax=Agaricus bisporus var. bisporus (strain H97 / ATCC MYA-4626 / FGSC 10389) TaxID=936046 RepID=UPI00029F5B68|nr:hypothetical protein AGABI2DRAFT_137009 [Agaricus bisporus var. bisporus H97]EKV46902.1 hypothetical protein AGABI2DRAFT_137009 [Agaricus bisporus var. bisporus H97]
MLLFEKFSILENDDSKSAATLRCVGHNGVHSCNVNLIISNRVATVTFVRRLTGKEYCVGYVSEEL